jgi:hypothetical protein
MEEELSKYGEELGLREPPKLHELIESHRSLRNHYRTWLKDADKAHEQARKEAYEDAKEYALQNHYIPVKKLRKMTLEKLMLLLEE